MTFFDEKLTFLQSQKFIFFDNFWEIPSIFNLPFFWRKIDIFKAKFWKISTIFGQFANFWRKIYIFQSQKFIFWTIFERFPWFSIFKILRRKTDIFKADFWKILAIVQQFLDQNDDKLDIFRAKDSFSDNFGEISLIFNFCTKKLTFEKQKLRNFDNFFDKFDIFWRKTDIF